STRGAKEIANAIGAREMTDITRHSPVAINLLAMKAMTASNWGGRVGAPFANFCLSNVPGPDVPLYLCGAELKYWSVVAPLPQGIGLFFGVTSYRDRIFISPTADRAMVPDPEFLEACIERSMKEHVAAAERLFVAHPELLAPPRQAETARRAHPGMQAMQRKSGAADGGTTSAHQTTAPRRARKAAPIRRRAQA